MVTCESNKFATPDWQSKNYWSSLPAETRNKITGELWWSHILVLASEIVVYITGDASKKIKTRQIWYAFSTSMFLLPAMLRWYLKVEHPYCDHEDKCHQQRQWHNCQRGLMTEENAHSDFPTSTTPRLYVAAWVKDWLTNNNSTNEKKRQRWKIEASCLYIWE